MTKFFDTFKLHKKQIESYKSLMKFNYLKPDRSIADLNELKEEFDDDSYEL